MSVSLARDDDERQPTDVAQRDRERATSVAQALDTLRAVLSEKGWTLDALAEHMALNRAYIGRVLNGEKSLTMSFLSSLPRGVEVEFYSRRAEQQGRIVVAPLDFEMARRALVAGLMGVMAAQIQRLPEKAGSPAKAGLK